MSNTMKTINIELEMPTVDEARRRLIEELKRAKAEGYYVIKLIHGYGSTGAGGALRHSLRSSLRR